MVPEQSTLCKGCNEAILTHPVIQALNSDWHPKCFRCSSCGQRLNNWYIQNHGDLYCRRDYWSKFHDRCNGCCHVIYGPVMVAGEHKYHPECFQCSQCQSHIGVGDLYALVERSFLYCGQCYRVPLSHQVEQVEPPISPPHTPRRKPHSIQMVEIPPTPKQHSQVPHNSRPHNGEEQHKQEQEKEVPSPRRLQLSLQAPDISTGSWRSSASYRNSFSFETGRLTPCVQISELDVTPDLHGLAVGDKILEVNGTAVKEKTLEEIKTLLTNNRDKVHVMVERDLSPLRLPPEEDSFIPNSPVGSLPSRTPSSDELNSPSTSEGETIVVLNQTVQLRPKGSLRAKGHSPSRRRSKSPSPCPSARQKSIDLSRSHSFSTRQQDQRVFRPADLLIGEVLGQGFFGQALKATHRVTGELMVLKELHNFDEDAQKSFLREVSMLRSLSHPCVLKFLGVLYRDKKFNLVTEYIDGGTLSDLLLDHSVELSWKQRIAFAKDIADGMSYLHSVNIIHRDLNSQNCLVRKDQTVVVADFGLAKIFPRHDLSQFSSIPESEKDGGSGSSTASSRKKKRFSRRKRGTVVGNPYWMAPEMMTKGVYDEKVDVFSYGIIVCETIARVTADPDYMPRSFDFGLNVEAFHTRFCKDVPEAFFMLAVLCSQIEPDQRPSFEKIQVLCEKLNLHVEHGKAVPPELQGNTVEFYRSLKEKMYGQSYTDVDSCTQSNTCKNEDIARDTSSHSEAGTNDDNFTNGDSDNCTNFTSDCIQDGVEDSIAKPAAQNSVSDNIDHSIPDGKLQSTSEQQCHSDSPNKRNEDTPSSASEVCTSHIVSPTTHSDKRNSELQDLMVNVDEGALDACIATTNEDCAYFSCSSDSASIAFSSPCLSFEDFASCRGSPNSTGSNPANPHMDKDTQNLNSTPSTENINFDISNGKGLKSDMIKCPPVLPLSPGGSLLLADDSLHQESECTYDNSASTSITDIANVMINHSTNNRINPCSPTKEYRQSMQLEIGTKISPPPLSLPNRAINLDECDV